MWLSPEFKLILIKEYEFLKQKEANDNNLNWNVGRILSKANYSLQTSAISEYIIPKSILPQEKQGIEYANEAELINYAVLGYSSKEWKAQDFTNRKNSNLRDYLGLEQLIVLANAESKNAELIRKGISKNERFKIVHNIAQNELNIFRKNKVLTQNPFNKDKKRIKE